MRSAVDRRKLEHEFVELDYDPEDDIPLVHYRRSPKRVTIFLFLASYAWAILAIIAMNVSHGSWWPVIFSLGALGCHLMGFLCLTAV